MNVTSSGAIVFRTRSDLRTSLIRIVFSIEGSDGVSLTDPSSEALYQHVSILAYCMSAKPREAAEINEKSIVKPTATAAGLRWDWRQAEN